MVKKNILETIGSTPMVRINQLCPNSKVNIFAKLEGFNPTGSIKDRIALRMVEAAEREGRLRKGHTIIEPTSGNTGIGLAIAGIVKGYPVEIVMSSAVSIERRKIIRSYGAKVILTPADEVRMEPSDWHERWLPIIQTNILCPTNLPMPQTIWHIMKKRLSKSGNKQMDKSIIWYVL